ncbi:hypothetical protein MHL31_07695 [Lutibacter sp. A80]|uniref:hypothetical protein n=1 Tax=Lutibacter sp. A80 TaxID=2918453 RepID=UPI001F0703E8|nr:hypothetical protein [Lutibacter sp. A80]UMB62067.1 hypothetical protein MHL31_07695 [Lutibacter sp. A80]
MKYLKIAVLTLAFFSITYHVNACTVAVISGKYTKDGRPLLWKNRDTPAINNQIVYFNDGKYNYVGLVNSKDTQGKSVWIGQNSTGFAIMNSASYNLNIGDNTKLSGLEGRIIKEGLASCATIEDFEKYLDNLPIPTRLEGNFGVIDAQGGAAMYEVNNKGYVKFDANDPKVAPFGYIIRSNYSFMGSFGEESSGYLRSNTANELFYNAMATNTFDVQFILQDVTRSLKHSLTKDDLYRDYADIPENTPTYSFFHDFIPRRSTASACVVQGVKKGEDPAFTTLWSIVGFPLTSIALPTWVKGENDFPDVLKRNDKFNDAPVCYAALELKKKFFAIRWGKWAAKYYVNINALINKDNTGIYQKIHPFENEIFKITNQKLDVWRVNGMKKSDLKAHYNLLNQLVVNMFDEEFDIDLN